jgi:hypothetical protein
VKKDFKIAYLINIKKMLANYPGALKSQLKDELRRLVDDEIDVLPLLTQQAEWNRKLFQVILENERNRLEECQRYLKVLQNRLQKKFSASLREVLLLWRGQVLLSELTASTAQIELIPFGHVERAVSLLMRRGPSSSFPRAAGGA